MSPIYDQFGSVANRAMVKPAPEFDRLASAALAKVCADGLARILNSKLVLDRIRPPRIVAANGDRLTRADVGLAPEPPYDGGRSIVVPLTWTTDQAP